MSNGLVSSDMYLLHTSKDGKTHMTEHRVGCRSIPRFADQGGPQGGGLCDSDHQGGVPQQVLEARNGQLGNFAPCTTLTVLGWLASCYVGSLK